VGTVARILSGSSAMIRLFSSFLPTPVQNKTKDACLKKELTMTIQPNY
jgi:hypothetical protein